MSKLVRAVVEAKGITECDGLSAASVESWQTRPLVATAQMQIAARTKIQRSIASKINERGEINFGTVRYHVEELGTLMRSTVHFPTDDAHWLLNLCKALDVECAKGGQMESSLRGEELLESQRDVVLSIKPAYSDKILDGRKTVELRRRFPAAAPIGALAYIYSTSPVKAIVGSALIHNVRQLPVEQIWTEFQSMAFIERDQFEKYFERLDHGFALVFGYVKAFPRPLPLSELRERFGFEPPQSFLYAKRDLRKAIEDEQAILSH